MPRLDLIIIIVGATDVFHWLQAGAPPVPIQEITADTNMLNYFGWHPAGPFRWNPKCTALAELARRGRQIVLRPLRRSTDVGRGLLGVRAKRAKALEVRREVHDPDVLVDNFANHLRQALTAARARADRVIVVRQPWWPKTEANAEHWENLWHGAVGDAFHDDVKVFYSTQVMAQLMAYLSERAARVANQLGVESYEIHSANDPCGHFYYDLIHFTPAGSAAVATILSDVILRNVAPGAATSMQLQGDSSNGTARNPSVATVPGLTSARK